MQEASKNSRGGGGGGGDGSSAKKRSKKFPTDCQRSSSERWSKRMPENPLSSDSLSSPRSFSPFFPFLYLRCYNNPRPLLEPRHEAVEPWNSLTLLQQAGIFEGISTRPKNSESLSVFPRWGTVAQKFYRPLLIFPPSLFISFRFVLGLFPLRENFNNACVLSINEDF